MSKSEDIFLLARLQKDIEDIESIEKEIENQYFKGLTLTIEVDTNSFSKQIDTLKLDLKEELSLKVLLGLKNSKISEYTLLKKKLDFGGN